MLKERIDEVYQSNWRYNMAEYYRGFKNKNKSISRIKKKISLSPFVDMSIKENKYSSSNIT